MHGSAELSNALFNGQAFTIYGNHTTDAPKPEQEMDDDMDMDR